MNATSTNGAARSRAGPWIQPRHEEEAEIRSPKSEIRRKAEVRGREARITPHVPSPIYAVTFDVGGTLIRPWPSVGHIYAEVAERHGSKGISPDALNRQFDAAWREFRNFNYTRTEWAALVEAAFHGLMQSPPSANLFSELYERFSEPGAWRIFEDVVPALEALAARGLKLGVISNWDRRLPPLLRRLGLYDYFDAVVVSCNIGFPKPSPVIFQQAARRLAVPPGAILHVGDSLELDVRGARDAGMKALLLRRGAPAGRGRISSLGGL